jgi:predicted nucleic acid-binding protein
VSADQPPTVFAASERLARRHVATLGVRTLDSLHVAAALELGAGRFWTFDDRQTRLAEAEGLATA